MVCNKNSYTYGMEEKVVYVWYVTKTRIRMVCNKNSYTYGMEERVVYVLIELDISATEEYVICM